MKPVIEAWIQEGNYCYAPRTTADVMEAEFQGLIELLRCETAMVMSSRVAFPAELEYERRQEEQEPIADHGREDVIRQLAEERSLLEEIPLPGTPVTEAERINM